MTTTRDEPEVPVRRYVVLSLLAVAALLVITLLVRPLIFSLAGPRDDANFPLLAVGEADKGPKLIEIRLNDPHNLPGEVVRGAIDYALSRPDQVILVGAGDRIEREIAEYGKGHPPRVSLVDAPEQIEMGEHPAAALRAKKRASVVVESTRPSTAPSAASSSDGPRIAAARSGRTSRMAVRAE